MTRLTYLKIQEAAVTDAVTYDVDYDSGTASGEASTLPIILVPSDGELNELTITNADTIPHVIEIYDQDPYGVDEPVWWIVHLLHPGQTLTYAFPPDGEGWTFPSVPVSAIRDMKVLFTSPTNGQVATYSNGVWINSDLPAEPDPATYEFADLVGFTQPVGTIVYVTDGCAMGPLAVFETTGNGTGVNAVFNGNDWKVIGTNITVSN